MQVPALNQPLVRLVVSQAKQVVSVTSQSVQMAAQFLQILLLASVTLFGAVHVAVQVPSKELKKGVAPERSQEVHCALVPPEQVLQEVWQSLQVFNTESSIVEPGGQAL